MLMIVKYPPSREISRKKLELAKEGDVVVLIQDAVLYALGDPVIDELREKGIEVYALREDFEIRGYSEDQSKVGLVDYSQFVDLVVEKGEKTIG